MNLKMFVFGEMDSVTTWVVAENKKQAIEIFENITGIDIDEECEGGEDIYVREANPNETMTFYYDCINPETDTMENLIKKYCKEPDIFATSDF